MSLSIALPALLSHRCAICSAFSTTIKERLTEGGASGAFFFFSKGENYIAKSCTSEELTTLAVNAQEYANFLIANPGSYISKILGVYRLRIYGNSLNFFVMNNLFYNTQGLTMHEKYDIKGSWVSRNAKPPVEGRAVNCSYCEQKFIYRKKKNFSRFIKPLHTSGSKSVFEMNSQDSKDSDTVSPIAHAMANMEEGGGSPSVEEMTSHCRYTVSGMHEPNVILKDNDLKFKIRLPIETAVSVLRQLRRDAEFLASLGIMDFSLLLGVHNTEYEVQAHHHSNINNFVPDVDRASFSGTGRHSILRKARNSMVPFASTDAEEAKNSRNVSFTTEHGEPEDPTNPSTATRETDLTTGSPGDGEGEESTVDVSAEKKSRRRTLTHSSSIRPAPTTVSSMDSTELSMTKMLEVFRVVGPDTYFLGIIDFQQEWNWQKKMERFFKIRVQGADLDGLSAVEPETYKERFLRKLEDIIDIDTHARGSMSGRPAHL